MCENRQLQTAIRYNGTMKIEDLITRIREHPQEGFAVLLPLIEKNGVWYVLFEVRSPSIPQGGEVCFPGGKIEKGETAAEAAVRETCEELLIRPDQIRMLTELPLQPQLSRLIHAYLGVLEDYELTFSKEETERIFLIPLKELLNEEPLVAETDRPYRFSADFPFDLLPQGRDYPFHVRTEPIYFYRRNEALIWGMTASVLHGFLEIVRTLPE